MYSSIVMTVIGPDRPGLVEALASLVAEHQGNWTESRMARLGGQFAGILRIEIPSAQVTGLQAGLQQLGTTGLTVSAVADTGAAGGPSSAGLTLELLGHDRPGIVRDVARALAGCGVNVEELNTRVRSAPMTGEPQFQAEARLRLPPGFEPAALRNQLAAVAQKLQVDTLLR